MRRKLSKILLISGSILKSPQSVVFCGKANFDTGRIFVGFRAHDQIGFFGSDEL